MHKWLHAAVNQSKVWGGGGIRDRVFVSRAVIGCSDHCYATLLSPLSPIHTHKGIKIKLGSLKK